ncbi:hypothetical protein ElyMa_002436000 [Elysia marginata]|uniref:Uncharacterized protein n=1 Tax=Elysia marginata TaxID=1093978 RepID=A0AAV4GI85_9GAST|nr:hypothetical protein ElyMa_002436000 [Elysia marginata]
MAYDKYASMCKHDLVSSSVDSTSSLQSSAFLLLFKPSAAAVLPRTTTLDSSSCNMLKLLFSLHACLVFAETNVPVASELDSVCTPDIGLNIFRSIQSVYESVMTPETLEDVCANNTRIEHCASSALCLGHERRVYCEAVITGVLRVLVYQCSEPGKAGNNLSTTNKL